MSFNHIEGATLFVLHSISTVFGLLLIKSSVSGLDKFSIEAVIGILTLKLLFGLSLYLIAFVLSLIILSKFPLGVSVSIMMPLSLVTATFMGYIFLNENISIQAMMGMIFIFIGIFFIYADTTKAL